MNRIVAILYLLEVGALLVIAPWTRFWERNYFIASGPIVEAIMTSHVARGTVSGLGVLSAMAGVVDAVSAWRAIWRR